MAPTILVVDDNRELLTLLQGLFEEAGYTVATAAKGKGAVDVARDVKPDVAVLDVLLPDMMGFHLAETLRSMQPKLPLVFITGVFKGGKHALDAQQKLGAVAYFEKPFDAKKLLEAVRSVAPVPVAAKGVPPPPPQEEFEVELDIDVEEDGPQDAMELTGRIKVTSGGDISAELRGADLTARASTPGPVSGTRPHGEPPPPPKPGAAARRPMRTGLLGDSLPGLINAFYLAGETGELGVQRGKVKKVVYFEGGQPVFALSNLAADRFGQFLVRVGKVKPEQMQDAAVVAATSKRRTGDVLIERGLIKDTERLYYVAQQVKAIIYSLFGWEDGQFVVSFQAKARAESIKLDVHPGNLIIRGVKKLYKPERLARLVPLQDRFVPSQQPAYQLNELELEKWEAQLLPLVDGTRTAAEVVTLAGRPEHQVRAFLAAMMGLNVLERPSSG